MEITFEGARTVDRIVALSSDVFAGCIGECQGDPFFGQSQAEKIEEKIHDLFNLLEGERLKENDLVDAVEEFWAKMFTQFGHDGLARFLGDFSLGVKALDEQGGTDVGGHDDDGVFEIDGATLAVGQAAIVEDLEEGIKDIGVGFLNFIKKNDTVGATADGFGKLAALLVTDIAWRRPDEAGDGMFFHVFGHIDADDSLFTIEKSGGKSAGEFGFAYAGRSKKKKRTDGSLGVFQA